MYKIFYGSYPIYNYELGELYPVTEAALNLEVNDACDLSLTIPPTHPHVGEIQKLKMEFVVLKNGKTIFKGRLVKDDKDFNNNRMLSIEGKLAALNDSIRRPYEHAGSPEDYFKDLISNHNSIVEEGKQFKIGRITVTDPNDYIVRSSTNYNTTWDLLKKLVDSMGGYLHIRYESDGDYIDWLDDFDYTNKQKVKFAENLIDITHEVTGEELYTACIPLGAVIEKEGEITGEDDGTEATADNEEGEEPSEKRVTVESVNDGSDVIYNQEMVEKYGWIFAPVEEVTWDDVTIPANLKTKAIDRLNNQGVMLKETLELSAIDLWYCNKDISSFEWCQYIQAESEPHNLNETYLLSRFEIDIISPENSVICLNSSKESLRDPFFEQHQNAIDRVERIEADYATNVQVSNVIAQKLLTATSQILQTAKEVTIGILEGYTTKSALEEYEKKIENTLTANKNGFEFSFSQLEERITEVGNEVSEKNQFIRLENGVIVIGKSDSPIQAHFTNDALEFKYNDQVVAKFTNEVLEVKNIAVENQMRFGTDWAIRPGNYITGKGYNLNDVWIGG